MTTRVQSGASCVSGRVSTGRKTKEPAVKPAPGKIPYQELDIPGPNKFVTQNREGNLVRMTDVPAGYARGIRLLALILANPKDLKPRSGPPVILIEVAIANDHRLDVIEQSRPAWTRLL